MNKHETEATARAAKASMRNPRAWRIDVWENLGWHWALVCNNVTLYESFGGGYHAMIADKPHESHYACSWGSHCPTKKTPQAAVDAAVKLAKQRVTQITEAMEDAVVATQRAVA